MSSCHSSKKDVQQEHTATAGATTETDIVTLKAMRFHARIGVLPHEAEIAQSIEVDASLWVRRSGARPTAKDIVDYRRVYDLVAEVVTRGLTSFLDEGRERSAARALDARSADREG